MMPARGSTSSPATSPGARLDDAVTLTHRGSQGGHVMPTEARRRYAAIILIGALGLMGCGGDDDDATGDSGSDGESSNTTSSLAPLHDAADDRGGDDHDARPVLRGAAGRLAVRHRAAVRHPPRRPDRGERDRRSEPDPGRPATPVAAADGAREPRRLDDDGPVGHGRLDDPGGRHARAPSPADPAPPLTANCVSPRSGVTLPRSRRQFPLHGINRAAPSERTYTSGGTA